MKEQSATSALMRSANTAAANLNACGEGVRKSIRGILQSFETPGTAGAARREMLECKIGELENLADLCDRLSERLADAGLRIRHGDDRKETLTELLSVNRFLVDQLRCEQDDASRVLNTLRGMACGCGKGGQA